MLKNYSMKRNFEYTEQTVGDTVERLMKDGRTFKYVKTHPRRDNALKEANNGLSIHKLRKIGHNVHVSHLRFAEWDKTPDGPIMVIPPYMVKDKQYRVKEQGGFTHITIKKAWSNETVNTSSRCSIDDNFCYKLGVKFALERIDSAVVSDLMTTSPLPRG
jgi:hypothetical protein